MLDENKNSEKIDEEINSLPNEVVQEEKKNTKN